MPSRGSNMNAQKASSSNQPKQPRRALNDRNLEQEDSRESSDPNAEERSSLSSSAEDLHCICGGNINDSDSNFLICCDRCNVWYHGKCVKISKKRADQIEYFYCPLCCAKSPGLKSVFSDNASDAADDSTNESNLSDENDSDFNEFTSLQDIFAEHNESSLSSAYRKLVIKKLNVSLKGPESSVNFDVTPAIPPAFRKVPTVLQKIRNAISDHIRHYVYNKRICEVVHMAAPSVYPLFAQGNKPTEEEVSRLLQKALDAAIEKYGWTARIPSLATLYKRTTRSKVMSLLSGAKIVATTPTRSEENLSEDEVNDTAEQPSECRAAEFVSRSSKDITNHAIEDFASLSQIFLDGREGVLTPEYQQCVLEALQVTVDHPKRRAEHDYSTLIPRKFQRFNKIVKNIRKSIMDCVRIVQFRMRLELVIEKALPEIRPLLKNGMRPTKHALEPILQRAINGEDWDTWGTRKPSISSVLSYASMKVLKRLCSGNESVSGTQQAEAGMVEETCEDESGRQKKILRSPRHTSYRSMHSYLSSDLYPQRRSKRRTTSPNGIKSFTQLKDVYVETVGGPFTSEYRRAAMACLNISPNYPQDLMNFDFAPAIPEFMKNDQTACELLEARLRITVQDAMASERCLPSTSAGPAPKKATTLVEQSGESRSLGCRSSHKGTDDENSATVEDDSSASTENPLEDDGKLKGFTSLEQIFKSLELGKLTAKYRNAAMERLNITIDYPESFTNFDFLPAIPTFIKEDSTVFCLLLKRLRVAAKSSQNFKRTMHIAHEAMPEIIAAVDNDERITSAKLTQIYTKLIERRGWTQNVPHPTYILRTVKKTAMLKDIHTGNSLSLGESFGAEQTDRGNSAQLDSLLQEAMEEADVVQMVDTSLNFEAALNAAESFQSSLNVVQTDGISSGPPPAKICKRESLFAHFDVKMEALSNTGNQPHVAFITKKTPLARVQRPQLLDVSPSSSSDDQHNLPGPSGISPASIESVHISNSSSPTPAIQSVSQIPNTVAAEISVLSDEDDDDEIQIIAPVGERMSSGKCGTWSPTRPRHALSRLLSRQASAVCSQSSTRSSNGALHRTTLNRHYTKDEEEILEKLVEKMKNVSPERKEQMMVALQEKVNRKVAERMLEITQCISADQRLLLLESVLNEE